jgi:D-amino-acid dehydrogenase
VVTTAGEVACGALVVAGGAWSPEMGAALGASLPIEPMKGQILHLALPAVATGEWPIVQPVLGYYLVPWPDGRVACGGTMEAAAGFDHRPTASGAHELLRECLRTAPGLADATLLEIRVGLRPVAADGHPVLGPVPGWDNLHVATGHGTDGLLLGPYSAALVARSMTGEALDPAAVPFGAGRFAG